MKKKIISIIVLIFIFIIKLNALYAADTKIITGLDGKKIEVPSTPKRIACFFYPAFDRILMFGKSLKVVIMPSNATPWACKFYPELKNVPVNSSFGIPDVERLLKLNIDLVFYSHINSNLNKIANAGIAIVCPYYGQFIPSSMNEYNAQFKKEILFVGEIFGPDTMIRSKKFGEYLDGITARINAITSKIPEFDKPKVYYGKAMDLCVTQGDKTIMRWFTELAGGIYLPKIIKKQYWPVVSPEQIIAWDPDIILLGMSVPFYSAKNNSVIKILRAYKSGKIYKIPAGISYWDNGSCETALLPLFLGKKFHPDLFKDWDIIQEMKRFYSEIYMVNITDNDVERILQCLPPI